MQKNKDLEAKIKYYIDQTNSLKKNVSPQSFIENRDCGDTFFFRLLVWSI
jgi:hypothetical protein